ncbi:MAG: exodeoxyribonuclease III [Candidatus Neomarinimicrobiota bacterium]|nr:MAG: exodeoxyribonuclease III [Candidatus Neomarinimicrobiota bacterium]
MRLVSWNVNGIRAAEKKGLRSWLDETRPDVLCLQETKARPDQVPASLLEGHGYHTYWHSAERPGYSGVATFCREEPLYVQEGLGIDRFDREGRVLITEHPGFLLYNIYFPNGQRDHERLQYKLDFYAALLEILDEQVASGVNVVIAGDWNTAHKEIDLARPKENSTTSGFLPEERAWIDTYVEHGYVDTFRLFHPEPERYSWWTYRFGARARNVGWRIDYFFVNEAFVDRVRDADIHESVLGSDHCPVSLDLDV